MDFGKLQRKNSKYFNVTKIDLRKFNFRQLINEDLKCLKKELLHLSINVDDLNIATATNKRIKHKVGFWEITAQELQVFK